MPRAPILHVHAEFGDDFARQCDYCIETGRSEWLDGLFDGVEEARAQILGFPEIGQVEFRDERSIVRRLVLRRLPLLVWYGYQRKEPIRELWLLRLWGASQERPNAPPSSWKML